MTNTSSRRAREQPYDYVQMTQPSVRDGRYSDALEQIKQILAKYRPDMTYLKSDAVLSPRILTLVIERSEAQIPTNVLQRLRPLVNAVLNVSESGIADLTGSPLPSELQTRIEIEAVAAYEPLARLHREITNGSLH